MFLHTILSIFLLSFSCHLLAAKEKIGLCIMATGRYDRFVGPLINSARNHFCTQHDVTYFVFTDGNIPKAKDIIRISQGRLGWPLDTLKRFEVYASAKDRLMKMNYLYALDADMLFTGAVGNEILATLVGTQHPGFVNHRGAYEKNRKSLAYVGSKEGSIYYAGGFWGGTTSEFLLLCDKLTCAINQDLTHGIIAVWHDESHLNRYFINRPPTKILDPSYCYPENKKLPFQRRLIALDKNHKALRKSLLFSYQK